MKNTTLNIDSNQICKERGTSVCKFALTNYKKVVSIKKNIKKELKMAIEVNTFKQEETKEITNPYYNKNEYGLTKDDIYFTKEKIRGQKFFLDNNFFEINGVSIPFSQVAKNSFINTDRYIAECNERANALVKYAKHRDLENLFITLTLPPEYHPYKNIYNKNNKLVRRIKNPDFNGATPKEGSKELTRMFEKIRHRRVYRDILKEDKMYFRVTEPHKSGVPHVHISLFVPKDKKEDIKQTILSLFPRKGITVEEGVNDSVAYLMKYILKTFDDFRKCEEPSALTCWYIKWGISRFYTSRTLVSLNIYRVLGGRYGLLELNTLYKNKDISVWLDDNKAVSFITENEYGSILYQKNEHINIIGMASKKDTKHIENSTEVKDKPILRSQKRNNFISVEIDNQAYNYNVQTGKLNAIGQIKPIKKMSDLKLFEKWQQFDFDIDNPQRFALLQNELIDRDIITKEKISPNIYNDDLFQGTVIPQESLVPDNYDDEICLDDEISLGNGIFMGDFNEEDLNNIYKQINEENPSLNIPYNVFNQNDF
jgi:hypothetical protein